MKVGIIRCMMTEDYCPGTKDFKAVREKPACLKVLKKTSRLLVLLIAAVVRGKNPCFVRENW